MRYSRIIIGLLTIVLTALFLFVGTKESPAEEPANILSFSVKSEAGTEQMHAWEEQAHHFVLFLPGYVALDQVIWNAGDEDLCIAGEKVYPGMDFGRFEKDREYVLSYTQKGVAQEGTILFADMGSVPAMYLDVQSGNMDYIHLEKGNEETGQLRLYDESGVLNYCGKLDSVKGRGNSSWNAAKKPYGLTLQTRSDLLGMGAAQRWVLLAEGYYSCINIRNKIVYDFAKNLGFEYTPDSRWVNLYLNGEYAGLYLLSERNEVDEERVNIHPETGFLISMEWDIRLAEQKYPHILTNAGQALRIHHSALSSQELSQQWQSVENAIMAEDGIDPVSGKHWQDLIDMESWAGKFILEEIFGNHDGGSFSQFYYWDAQSDSGKIYAGPVWDYDLAMGGNETWLRHYTNYFIMNREYKEDGLYTPWFYELYRKEAFLNCVKQRFRQEFLPAMEQLLDHGLDSCLEEILISQKQDARRWGISEKDLLDEIDYIRDFLSDRMAFLSDAWIHETEYHIVRVEIDPKDLYGHFAIEDGQNLPELPDYEYMGGIGWYDEDTDEPFDIEQPIYEDARIYIKKEEKTVSAIHYLPLLVIMAVFPVLLLWDRCRSVQNGGKRNDTVKVK